jgi:hypothetical protein
MPDKTFHFTRSANTLLPLALPAGTTAAAAMERVLRLPSVCSKRFLTNKVSDASPARNAPAAEAARQATRAAHVRSLRGLSGRRGGRSASTCRDLPSRDVRAFVTRPLVRACSPGRWTAT